MGFCYYELGGNLNRQSECQFCCINLGALSGEGEKIITYQENLDHNLRKGCGNSRCDEDHDDDDRGGLKGFLAGSHRRLIKSEEKSRCGAETKSLG